MTMPQHQEDDISKMWVVRMTTRFLPFSKEYSGSDLFVKQGGRWLADFYHISIQLSLGIVGLVPVVTVVASPLNPLPKKEQEEE